MPKPSHMNAILKALLEEYRQGKENSQETPEAFRTRMIRDLQETEPDDLILKNTLPEKLEKYRIAKEDQDVRRQRSLRMREKKVYAYTAQMGRQDTKMPPLIQQVSGIILYYLTSSNQTALAEEFMKVMTLSDEPLEEAAKRILAADKTGDMDQADAENQASDEQYAAYQAVGAMLVRLLEPLSQITPENLADLPDEEAESKYAMYHALLELVQILPKILRAENFYDSKIVFRTDDRRTCENALKFLKPLERIEHQTDLICNPYYQCLDTKAITKGPDRTIGFYELANAFEKGDDKLCALGGDLDTAVQESREEVIDKLYSELRNRGFRPDSTGAEYTRLVVPEKDGIEEPKAREEKFEPTSQIGMAYIYGGGKFFVTQDYRQVEMHVEVDSSHEGTERKDVVHCEATHKNAALRIRKAIRKELGLAGTILIQFPNGNELDLNDPEHAEYIYNGGEVMLTGRNKQMILTVTRDDKNRYGWKRRFTPENARFNVMEELRRLQMTGADTSMTREDGRTFDLKEAKDLKDFFEGTPLIAANGEKQVRLTYDSEKNHVVSEYTERYQENQAMEAAAIANEREWELKDLYQQLRHSCEDSLKTVYEAVKDADPELLKSSPQYKSMRRSMKALKDFLQENVIEESNSEQAAEKRRRLKELTTQVFDDARAYIAYKGEGTTDRARRRVAAAKEVNAFADQQLKVLNQLTTLSELLKESEGKESLEKLMNERVLADEKKFQNAVAAFASEDRSGRKIGIIVDSEQNKDQYHRLYHRLDLDRTGDRKTLLSEAAQKEAQELLGYMVLKTVYLDDQEKYSADPSKKSSLTQLAEKEETNLRSIWKLVTETPAFRQKLSGLSREELYRIVTDPEHRSLKELAEAVKGQVSKEAADKVAEEVPMKSLSEQSLGTEFLLRDMRSEYRQGEGREQETVEQFRKRMLAALNEKLTFEELEAALPEEYRKYLIRDPKIQEKREKATQKVRDVRVAFWVDDMDHERNEPYPVNRSTSTIQSYLRRHGQAELADEYAKVMDSSPERQKALEEAPGYAANNVSLAAYDRGSMLAKLCEPFKNLTISDITNMTPEEKLNHMEELLFLHSIAMNTEQILHQTEKQKLRSLIKFSAPARELCNHALDLMEAAGIVAKMTDLMTNPCYKYLDVERLFKEQNLFRVVDDSISLSANNLGAIGRLGKDIVSGVLSFQRENVIRIEEQLKNLGVNLSEAVWTDLEGTKLAPDGPDGIAYITEGHPAIVTYGKQKLTVRGGRDQEIQIRPYVPLDDCVSRLRKKLRELGFDPDQTMFAAVNGDVIDLEREKDAADYAEGKAIYASQGDRQVVLRGLDRNGDPKWEYTKFHYTNEYQRTQTEIADARTAAQQADAVSRQAIAAAEQNIAAAADALTNGKAQQLADVRRSIRKAESIFTKGSLQFGEIKDALKQYAEMPDVDRNSPESVEEIKVLLEGIRQNVQTYLGNKQGEGTTKLERKRVRAVRQVQDFVQQQLEQLGIMEQNMTGKAGQEQQIRERETKLQEREAKAKELLEKSKYSQSHGFQVPEQVQKYYDKKYHVEEYYAEKNKKSFLEEARKFANEEYPETTPATTAIDGELLEVLERYGSLTDSTNWNATEILPDKIKEVAAELLVDVVLKNVIRNDQFAHPENPTAGLVNQLADKLELKELKKIVSETPTMQTMLQNVTGQNVTEFILELAAPKQKEKLLKIMNEIPASARKNLNAMPENQRNQGLLSKLKNPEAQKAAAPK